MNTVFKKLKTPIITAAFLAVISFSILCVSDIIKFSKEATDVFVATVLPSVLPFSLLTGYLKTFIDEDELAQKLSPLTKKLFGVSGYGGVAVIYGLCSGMPTGAAVAHSLTRGIDAEKSTCLSAIPSPLLIIACVGKLTFGSLTTGIIAYCSCIASTLVIYALFFKRDSQKNLKTAHTVLRTDLSTEHKNRTENLALETFLRLAESYSLTVLFYVVASFSVTNPVFIKLIESFSPKLRFFTTACLSGLIETTFGCNVFGKIQSALSVSLCAASLTLGGPACILPCLNALSSGGNKKGRFLLFKTAQSLCTFIFCFIFLIPSKRLPLL